MNNNLKILKLNILIFVAVIVEIFCIWKSSNSFFMLIAIILAISTPYLVSWGFKKYKTSK